MKESLKTIKNMDKGSINIMMEVFMLEVGRMI